MVIYNSINTVTNDVAFFTETNTTKTLSGIEMGAFPVTVMCVTAISKPILFFLCYRVKNPTMSALAADHINDVVSNIVALVCGLVGKVKINLNLNIYIIFKGSFAYKSRINQKAIFIDPIGAILISVYIISTWVRQANGLSDGLP